MLHRFQISPIWIVSIFLGDRDQRGTSSSPSKGSLLSQPKIVCTELGKKALGNTYSQANKLLRELRSLRTSRRGSGNTTPPKTSAREAVSLAISILALAISISTTYLNTFRQLDDIRVVVAEPPEFRILSNGNLKLSDAADLVFINAGNRTASIVQIGTLIIKLRAGNNDWQASGPCEPPFEASVVYYKNSPFPLRPAELFPIKVNQSDADGRSEFYVNREEGDSSEMAVRLCMVFDIATPSRENSFRTVSVHVSDGQYGRKRGRTTNIYSGRSNILVQESGTVFFPN